MSRPSTKFIYVIIFGKRPIAAFRIRSNAETSLKMMSKLLPKSMSGGNPRIEQVPVQD